MSPPIADPRERIAFYRARCRPMLHGVEMYASVRVEDLAAMLDDLDSAATALVYLRAVAGSADRLDQAEAYLTSLGFAYPFTGYRNPPPSTAEGTARG